MNDHSIRNPLQHVIGLAAWEISRHTSTMTSFVSQTYLLAIVVADTAASTGIDQSIFLVIVSALGGTISALATALYTSERSRRIKAEDKLDEIYNVTPDIYDGVRRLVRDKESGSYTGPDRRRRRTEDESSLLWYQRPRYKPSAPTGGRRRPR